MNWKPATIEQAARIVHEQFDLCSPKQTQVFEKFRVEPYSAPILRLGTVEQVVILARPGNQVIYWEDVEEGFGVSPISAEGQILEQDCNQNDLSLALNAGVWQEDARIGDLR